MPRENYTTPSRPSSVTRVTAPSAGPGPPRTSHAGAVMYSSSAGQSGARPSRNAVSHACPSGVSRTLRVGEHGAADRAIDRRPSVPSSGRPKASRCCAVVITHPPSPETPWPVPKKHRSASSPSHVPIIVLSGYIPRPRRHERGDESGQGQGGEARAGHHRSGFLPSTLSIPARERSSSSTRPGKGTATPARCVARITRYASSSAST